MVGVDVGSFIPNLNTGGWIGGLTLSGGKGLLSFNFILYTIEISFLLVFAFVFLKLFFSPYKLHFYARAGKGIRWAGSDFGRIVEENGQKAIKLFFRKKLLLQVPPSDVLIPKNKWTCIVSYLKVGEDEYKPFYFNDAALEVVPIRSDEKTWFIQRNNYVVEEYKDTKGFLERNQHFLGYATLGVIVMLTLVLVAKYSNDSVMSANNKAASIVSEANRQASSAASQIATALSGIQINNVRLPAPQNFNNS